MSQNTVEDMEEMESRQELVIDRIMSSLTEAENLAAESASEMYAGSIRGQRNPFPTCLHACCPFGSRALNSCRCVLQVGRFSSRA